MEKLKIRLYYSSEMDTLDLWIDDPGEEVEADPLGDNIIVKLDGNGKPIGLEVISLEKLNSGELEKLPNELRVALRDTLRKLMQAPAVRP